MFGSSLTRRDLIRRGAASLGIAALSGLSLAGCGRGSDAKNGEVNLFIWSEYVPDDVVSDFEKEFGIKVNISTYASGDEMLAKVKNVDEGTFDLLQPSNHDVQLLAKQGKLEKLDTSKLTNIKNNGKDYLGLPFDPENEYTVPYMASVVAIGVDTAKVKDKISSWADLYDSKYKDMIVVPDDAHKVIGITELALGMGTVNAENESDIERARQKVMDLKPNIKLFDSTNAKSELASGDCPLAITWTAEIALAKREVPTIEVVYPKEGAQVGIDNWAILKGSKNRDNAIKFIDYMLRAKVAKRVSEAYPYVQPNAAAVALMGDDYRNNEAENVPPEVYKNGHEATTLPTDVLKEYNDIWTELKS